MIELLLGRRVPDLLLPGEQHAINIRYDAKSIRLDVVVEDLDGKIYDIEMQVVTMKNLPKRSRYYHGMLAMEQLEMGASYDQLRETYVIFLCKDGLGKDRKEAIYSYQNRCDEDPSLALGDGMHTIFVNAASLCTKGTEELRAFLAYVHSGDVRDDKFVRKLDEAVKYAKEHKEWRLEYMLLWEHEEMARVRGLEEGRAEGRTEGRMELCYELFRDGTLSSAEAGEKLGLASAEDFLDECRKRGWEI